jgi:MFS family permease
VSFLRCPEGKSRQEVHIFQQRLITPLEFHADRGAISVAFTIQNSVAALLAVFIGNLADRFGARKLIVPGLALVGVILISALAIGGRLWQLYLFYAALAMVGGATASVPYSLVVRN